VLAPLMEQLFFSEGVPETSGEDRIRSAMKMLKTVFNNHSSDGSRIDRRVCRQPADIRGFNLISIDEEKQLGAKFAQEVEKHNGF
jgi:hypothetical protein